MNKFAASRREFLRTAGFTAGSCLLSASLRAAGIPEPSAGDAPADYTLHIIAGIEKSVITTPKAPGLA
jgi:hypothetical protein